MNARRCAASLAACLLFGSPGFTGEPPAFADPELIAEAVQLSRTHRYIEALLIYETLLAIDPLHPGLLYEAGSNYYGVGDFETCVAYGMKAREISKPQSAYDLLGRCLDALGEHERAEAILREGVAEYPTEARMHFNLAVTFVQRGKEEEALAEVERAIAIQPSHAASHQFLSMAYKERHELLPTILTLLGHLSVERDPARSETSGNWLYLDLGAGSIEASAAR